MISTCLSKESCPLPSSYSVSLGFDSFISWYPLFLILMLRWFVHLLSCFHARVFNLVKLSHTFLAAWFPLLGIFILIISIDHYLLDFPNRAVSSFRWFFPCGLGSPWGPWPHEWINPSIELLLSYYTLLKVCLYWAKPPSFFLCYDLFERFHCCRRLHVQGRIKFFPLGSIFFA